MLTRIITCLALMFTISNIYATTPKERQFEVLLSTHVSGEPHRVVSPGYLIYYPEDYETKIDQDFPVVLFLHGAGENGTSPSILKSKGGFLPGLVEKDWNFPFIIVSPLARWSMDSLSQAPYLEEIMAHVRANNRIDTTREFVAGLSQGGKGARLYAERHADTIAGLVSAAGYAGGDNIAGLAQSNIPVVLSHNKDDGTISYKSSQGYYNKLIQAGATNVVYDLRESGGHNAWTRVFKDIQLWDWLLSFSNAGSGISISNTQVNPESITPEHPSIQFSAEVSDNQGSVIGIESVHVSVSALSGIADDILVLEKVSEGAYSAAYSIDTTLLLGTYEFVITATDYDGNVKEDVLSIEVVPDEAPSDPGIERIIQVQSAGKISGGTYFPLEMAFDSQPSFMNNDTPEYVLGGSRAPYYANRLGYVDFGEQWYNIRITQTWTLYRAWSGGNQTPYQSLWWDDDIDAVNDSGLIELDLNFNSARNLQAMEDLQWVRDGHFVAAPISPQARYLLVQAPEHMTNRALEYAFVGWDVTDDGESPPEDPSKPELDVIQPHDSGRAAGGSYFPMQHAFDAQPTLQDGQLSDVDGGQQAPYYSERVGYIDFGENWESVSIVQTFTQYRPWSGGEHTPYSEVWWDDDIDTLNDGITESSINFNSAQNLANKNERQWVKDVDSQDAPIKAKSRYLMLRAPANMTNRASEYLIVGYQ
ncbi:carboxylesterase family protein [Agaribacter flavus]|uniref:Poly(3-hydroxybutyrate) depolymerase n=1 Tax=Agaribacter flavus TaxID=1902781 RepID=A0ABV7FVR6_9ALTE